MKKLLFTAQVLTVLALTACNQKAEQKTEETTTTTQTEMAPAEEAATVNVKVADLSTPKDFVCGMDVAEGSIADTASHDGKLYGFCSKECKAEFVKEPAKYLAEAK
ncbi:MAG TPA: YHS domain-containing protein [Chitinophagales bacterium]|nr:YHS domain-containing protein [Chitinophagales bacterium]